MEKKILLFLFPLSLLLWVRETDGPSPPARREKQKSSLSFAWIIQLGALACLLMSVSLSISMCLVSGRGSSHLLPFSLSVRMPGSLTSSSRNLHISPYDDEGSSPSLRSITSRYVKDNSQW